MHDVGLPGLDGGRGGRHLLLPPGYDRDVPDGYFVHRSTTRRVAPLLRTVPVEGDLDAAMAALKTLKMYALDRPGDVLPFADVTDRPFDLTPVRWEDGLESWARLHQTGATSPAIFRRQVGVGSVYFVAFRDLDGAWLDGARSYRLRVPSPVPASLFWSVTAYDLHTRSQLQTPQDRAVLGSLKDDVRPDADGRVDLYFGPTPPAGAEGRWIQTDPTRGFFLYFRVYGPQAAAFDGAWRPDDLVPTGRAAPSA